MTAEVVTAWRRHGIDSILIKGPTVAAWLYATEQVRSYSDSDLLVPPGQLVRAREVLGDLGFLFVTDAPRSDHATTWYRPGDGAMVDLHHSLWSATLPPRRQWDALRTRWTEPMRIGGTHVTVPILAGRALIVAVHAAQHLPPDDHKPLEDLRRAIAVADVATWRQASALAGEIGLVGPLATGLCRDPDGSRVAGLLPETRQWLRSGPGAVRVARLIATKGAAERLRIISDVLFPSPDMLRWTSPLARRGRRGLVAAYVVRAAGLTPRSLPSLIAWRRSRLP